MNKELTSDISLALRQINNKTDKKEKCKLIINMLLYIFIHRRTIFKNIQLKNCILCKLEQLDIDNICYYLDLSHYNIYCNIKKNILNG